MKQSPHARVTQLTVMLAFALALGAASAGCARQAAPPSEPAGITGEITYYAMATGPNAIAVITVEGRNQPEGAVSDKAIATVTDKTAVFDAQGAKTTAEALEVGTRVVVWFTGPVAESYPVQGAASAVQVVDAP